MNTQFKSGSTLTWKLFGAITAGVGLVLDGQLAAQTFSTLYSFPSGNTNSFLSAIYGVQPNDLTLSSNILYGSTLTGGAPSDGTILSIHTDGTGFTNIYVFTGASDGANPNDAGGLVLSGNTLYGTTENGSTNNNPKTDAGRVFKVNLDGTGFTTLHMFTGGSDGATPVAHLVVAGDTIFGTASTGANWDGGQFAGTVFKLSTDGSNFTPLHDFTGNPDGADPLGSLILSGNTLYGTAFQGGDSSPSSFGNGTIFAVNTDGTGFTNLYIFHGGTDGANPAGGLTLVGNILYGTAENGGAANGTLFALNTDGTDFKILHTFTGTDGANPVGDLLLSGDTFYGTTVNGGSSGNGTIFSIKTNGTGFTTLYNFTPLSTPCYPCGTNSDGASPNGHLVLVGSTLYGSAASGGLSGNGTIFGLSLGQVSPPQLSIVPAGPNVLLTWPAVPTGFTLQSSTNLASPLWTTNLPPPVIVYGQNTVTNLISGTQQFFRLSQ